MIDHSNRLSEYEKILNRIYQMYFKSFVDVDKSTNNK